MIHRTYRGQIPKLPHTVFEPEGKLAFEHCFTRQGFDGAYTILYHREAPHWVEGEKDLGEHPGLGGTAAAEDGPLRRAHFQTGGLAGGASPFLARRLLLWNADVGIWYAQASESEPTLVANVDGDELVYVYRGRGRVHSALGDLEFAAEDYVYVPRGLPHRWVLHEPVELLVMEGRSWVDVPRQFRHHTGQLDMGAPYSHRDFGEPEWWPNGRPEGPRQLVSQRNGRLTELTLANDPYDVYGWDGQVWPFTFPIRSFRPKTGLVHLPPTIHTTFAGGGFVVCSFVPRMVDTHEAAIPCPYAHSSVDCDEVIFYVEGSFTSRKGITSGSVTLHPAGIAHGPHPGTYEASVGTKRTEELAVMIDTFKPLAVTDHAWAVEDRDYNTSWVR
jgi:homogentisate 1,2-dioxygenase